MLPPNAVVVGHSIGASILLKALVGSESQPAFKGVFLWGGDGWGDGKKSNCQRTKERDFRKLFQCFLSWPR